ncbi:pseudouridine synthase [Thermomonas carbonis]|uniref:Pseudouridine synthase n=1 Tax=Thermomonas carbonis TaxID=1463158 RepID=A0A7G9SP03_9GAMM|nr:pseudouridine synthase [Thermomonas carbonis]QNN69578.1 pseudouridine synthase [Thermomonas carbonis]GHB94013.1 pseudouridine synthase [Thermomonas carbonis]
MKASDHIHPSHLQLPPGPWATLLDGMCARFPRIDREVWIRRFARGRVQDANGQVLATALPYRAGMEVRYFREVDDEPRIPFEVQILFADADLVVADKPHFLPVTPAGRFVTETLLARLRMQLDNPALVPLHRIDRETAGLVLFSANPATRAAYQSLFPQRAIDKTYEAIAPPLPALPMPHVHRSQLRAGEPFFRMCEADGAPNSETRIEVIERGSQSWRYRLQPVTGRKHQLRVHMAALGAPILDDSLYPALAVQAADDFSRPLQLLAKALHFIDPLNRMPRVFESRQWLSLAQA